MGYTTDETQVRVDFFKPSGKWYCTESLRWDRYATQTIVGGIVTYESPENTFRRCLQEQFGDRLIEMTAVCLEPYSDPAYPLLVRRG